jgi:hypothetical protein
MMKTLALALFVVGSACANASQPPPGPPGEQGPMGEMGTMGTPGAAGQACWDLNNNGTCDPATEDTNNDETCDVGDCIGPQGPQGQPGQNGAAGTTGQLGVGAFGTAALTVVGTSTTFALVPGLTTTIDVPAASVVMIATDGGVATTSTAATGFSQVDIVVLIDGALPPNGGYKRVIAANTTGITGVFAPWSMSVVVTLAAGSHTIEVQAGGTAQGANATVSGDVNSVNQGSLSVLVLKQ